jgi:outer membrane protein OmpA-like peptidoglycan-associated protein
MRKSWRGGLVGVLLLTTAMPGLALAQETPSPAPSRSAQELKAAIAEIKRRLEEQRQTAGTPAPAAGEAAEDLRGARGRLEGLAQTMSGLRAERDALRGQLLQARDELARVQAQAATADQERDKALTAAQTRIASLEKDLEAARSRADEAGKARAEAVAAAQQGQEGIAERDARLAEAQSEVQRLQGLVATNEVAQRTLSQEAEGLRLRTGELEGELTRVKAEAQEGQAATERRLTAELAAMKDRLGAAERESAELRTVAASSVEEVRSLSEQLLATLAEKDKLVAASVELSSSQVLQELQLVARDEGNEPPAGGGGLEQVQPAAGPAEEAEAEAAPATVRLAARSDSPPTVESWSKTVLEGSLFTAGAERLAPEATQPLSRLARTIRDGTGKVRIVGHTDSNGEAESNRRLSLRRAQSVRDYLVSTYGIDPARFTVDGQGEDTPITNNDTVAGRRANRRVEVFVAR